MGPVMMLCIALAAIVNGGSYELIARMKDTRNGLFDKNSFNEGNQNANDPEANAYSIIGQIGDNLDKYRDADGYYQFKLIYGNTDGSSYTLEWKQTSWIETSPITGFEEISGISGNQDKCYVNHDGCCCFKGLGLTGTPGAALGPSYIDGNANEDCWCSGVVTFDSFTRSGDVWEAGTGIPAFNYKVAYSEELYIYQPDPCIGVTCDPGFACDPSDGACSRKCEEFDIDGFLLECSMEWDNAGNAMTTEAVTRQSEDTRLEGLITDEAATRLEKDNNLEDAINAEAATRGQEDNALQTSINDEKTAREQAINGEQAARAAAISGEETARAAAIAAEESARGAAITAEATVRGDSDDTLQGNIDSEEVARKAACDALQTLIDNAQSEIDDLTDRLDGFKEPKEPKAQNIGINVDHNLNDVNGKKFWVLNMEIVIVILLVMNLSMMIYVHCISKGGKHKKDKHKYRKVRYNESDVDSEANLKC